MASAVLCTCFVSTWESHERRLTIVLRLPGTASGEAGVQGVDCMGGWIGAAPEQLEELGRHMRAAAAQLEALRRDVDGLINLLMWEGADADTFNEQWLSHLSASVIAAESMLDDAANVLMANARQQVEASSDSSGFYDALESVTAFVGAGGAALDVLDYTKHLAPLAGRVNAVLGKFHWPAAVDDALSKASWMKSVDGVLGKNPLTSAADDLLHGQLSTEALGVAAGTIDTALNGWSFVHDLSTNPGGADTYNKGVESALGAAALVAVAADAVPVVGEAIVVGQIAYGIGSAVDPELGKQIVGGVGDAAKAVVRGGEEEIKAADAASRVMSSGVRGALSLIHVHL